MTDPSTASHRDHARAAWQEVAHPAPKSRPRKTRVLLLGALASKYRTRAIIDFFCRDLRDGDYEVGFATSQFPRMHYGRRLWQRASGRLLRTLQALLDWIAFLSKAPLADVIYLLPINPAEVYKVRLLRRFFRARIIADFYTSPTLYLVARDKAGGGAGGGSSAFPAYERARRWDRALIENVDVVVSLSRAEFELVAKLVGADTRKARVEVITTIVPPRRRASPTTCAELRVCWWGMLSPWHGLEDILQAIRLAREHVPVLRLTLFCLPYPEAAVAELAARVENLRLQSHVTIRTDASFSNGKLEHLLCTQCDLALGIFSGTNPVGQLGVPTKAIDALAMGLPVLSGEATMVAEFFDRDHDLFVCAPDATSIAGALVAIAGDPAERARRAACGHERWRTTFSPAAFNQRMESMMASIGAQ